MPSSVVRADYDALKRTSQSFGQNANEARQSLQRLRGQMETLQNGDWLGAGANAFYGEMNETVVPTLGRLVKALDEAQRLTLQIGQLMKAAEDEAASYLNGQGSGAGPATGGESAGGDAGGTLGVGIGAGVGAVLGGMVGGVAGAGVGAALGSVVGEAIGQAVGGSSGGGGGAPAIGGAGNPLTVGDPHAIFSDGNLRGMVGTAPQGADTPALRSAMNALAGNPTGADLDRVLNNIADARGVPFEDIKAQHDKFLQVRAQAEEFRQARGLEEIPAVNTTFHEEFMGTTPQLRFGQMVGEAFGIDPVFGAMLSPTGGMVGPGNYAFTPSNDSAIGYHGVAHDAAGYLYNYHGVGPGYDYLNREGLDRGNPLTGQMSGTRYWTETIHPSTSRFFQVKDSAVEFTRSGIERVGEFFSNASIF
jgi:WXG100 family type VII secretion target